MLTLKKWGYVFLCFVIAIITIIILAININPVSPRIIGGQDALDGKYPYMVSLRSLSHNDHFCGGSIINNRWILTAAHCIIGLEHDSVKVVAGTNLINGEEEQVYQSEHIVPHEHFNPPPYSNDIGLIRVNKNIEFNKKVKPIELTKIDIEEPGQRVTIIGWGITETEYFPNKLQEITLKIADQHVCKDKWISSIYKINITKSHICTFTNYGEGTCNGDSGGPLVADGFQIGIVSLGYPPCAVGYPDVYTRVYTFRKWIAEQTKTDRVFCRLSHANA